MDKMILEVLAGAFLKFSEYLRIFVLISSQLTYYCNNNYFDGLTYKKHQDNLT